MDVQNVLVGAQDALTVRRVFGEAITAGETTVLPAAVILAFDGHVTRALILGGLGAGAVSTADNVLRPAMFSGRVHINGLVVFVSLLGGLAVFGLLGIILGPVLVVTALSLLNGYLNEDGEPERLAPR